MPLHWMDVSDLSFNSLLLLESVQLGWMKGYIPEKELAIALRANPAVEWFFRHKCPELRPWMDAILAAAPQDALPTEVRAAEIAIMEHINDWLIYALDPGIYAALPFLGWDSSELTGMTDFTGKTVIDVGPGTGRQTFTVAPLAKVVFSVEPVGNLRAYLRSKAKEQGFTNIFPVDGLITVIPFPADFADVTMSGHVYGDEPSAECRELERVTKPGGLVLLIPGNNDEDNAAHRYLLSQGYRWSRFEEPSEGMKRKYWKWI